MAELSDFLGSLVSSISDARVISDAQSLAIAREYANNDLLQNFAVPRMRIENVEFTIPLAIDTTTAVTQPIRYAPIDISHFTDTTILQIQRELLVDKLSTEITNTLRDGIADNIKILQEQIKTNTVDNALSVFSHSITNIVASLVAQVYKEARKKAPTADELSSLQKVIIAALPVVLKGEIKVMPASKLKSLNVIVEAARLREIKPENIITVKMTISEQGMEWVKIENNKGEFVGKLLPE